MANSTCSFEGCGRPIVGRSLCNAHYLQMKSGKDLIPVRERRRPYPRGLTWEQAVLFHVPKDMSDQDCWEVFLANDRDGYARIGWKGRLHKLHRAVFEVLNGKTIPDGMLVRHSCDNPPCVNPAHLEVGTPAQNMDDKVRRGRSGVAKLTTCQVLSIYSDTRMYKEIAADYGISLTTVHGIKKNKTWRHVTSRTDAS